MINPTIPIALLAATMLSLATSAPAATPDMQTLSEGIWVDRSKVANLITGTPGWFVLKHYAQMPYPPPNLADGSQDAERANIAVFARALYYLRTGDASARQEVINACMDVIGTENGSSTLIVGRKLISYVLAADLVGLPNAEDARFRAWLTQLLNKKLSDERTLRETNEVRPNNWGTLAGASRLAAAAYLGKADEVARVATVFKGYLGDRSSYDGFVYGDLDWQADPNRPVGINPAGATKLGHNIDGVLPEEMRRSGSFTWPPPKENYVYTGLQGAVAQAVILERAGYPAFEWQDRALFRAFNWLETQANYPAEGDDTWMPFVINEVYAAKFKIEIGNDRPGKNVDYTEWTEASDLFEPLRPSWRHLIHNQ